MKHGLILSSLLLVSACASLGESALRPQQDSLADVLRVMGEPSMRWQDADGKSRLAYPRQSGTGNLMVTIDADGKFLQVEKVLDLEHFARVREGMSKEEVLRLLGPSVAGETIYFSARDELAWTWFFQDVDDVARFNVLFDASKGTVRKTAITPFRVIVGSGDR